MSIFPQGIVAHQAALLSKVAPAITSPTVVTHTEQTKPLERANVCVYASGCANTSQAENSCH